MAHDVAQVQPWRLATLDFAMPIPRSIAPGSPSAGRAACSAALGLAAVLALVACGSVPPVETLAPNANLVAQGLPPIPMSLVRQVEPYTEFRGHGLAGWHPVRREMLVVHRAAGGNTSQLFRVTAPGATPEPLTDTADPVTRGSWEPRDGRYLVFARSGGGSEADQLYRLDPDTWRTTLLTDPDQRHDLDAWLNGGRRLIYSSVPLDRTAAGGTRAEVRTTLTLLDPLAPDARRVVAVLPGSGWGVSAVSPDDTQAALTRYVSAAESQTWLLDLASGQVRQVLPAPGSTDRHTHFADAFTADGRGLFVVTDRAGEFRELARLDLASGRFDRITGHIAWDVAGVDVSRDGRHVAVQMNVDGRGELRLFDGLTLKELPVPALPAGSVGRLAFQRSTGELAFAVNSVRGPSQLFSLDLASGRVEAWTQPHTPPGVDTSRFAEQQIVRWPSFDGRVISGLLNMPPARFEGPRPVLIDIHGGPEAQATAGFLGRYSYLVNELGIVLIQPNVRGSAGYGKTFLSLDNGMRREDSVKDIGALLDWIATQPQLDASKVLVAGGSYGGYMSLAVSTLYGERIAGAISDVGISNFVTFLRNTESYRRDLRRVEYGDERDPEMAAFLERISPLTRADRIIRPLFIIQGRNDPRVPYTEAEQMVASLKARGVPVWYLLGLNEGHGFARKENADFRFHAMVRFIEQTLGVTHSR